MVNESYVVAGLECDMSTPSYPVLFSLFKLGDVKARNKIISTSHRTSLAEGGARSERLIAYHPVQVEGGYGMVMVVDCGAIL